MIMRVWRGLTTEANADAFELFLRKENFQSIAGFHGMRCVLTAPARSCSPALATSIAASKKMEEGGSPSELTTGWDNLRGRTAR
jgi:hypothetical protein